MSDTKVSNTIESIIKFVGTEQARPYEASFVKVTPRQVDFIKNALKELMLGMLPKERFVEPDKDGNLNLELGFQNLGRKVAITEMRANIEATFNA